MLAVPDLDKKIRMEVDTLDYVMGGVLSIECKNVRYGSHWGGSLQKWTQR